MKARRDRIARANILRQQMWRMEAARLAQLDATLAQIKESESAVMRLLEQRSLPHDPTLLLERLRTLAVQRREIEEARVLQIEASRAHGLRAKQVEKLFSRVDAAWRTQEMRAESMQLANQIGARGDVSAR